jgi:uncharacterized membrane protein
MIGVTFLRPLFLIALLVVPLMVWAWWRWPPPLPRGRSVISLVARVLLVALLAFALSGARLTTQPTRRALVAVVDLSASVKAGKGLDEQTATVRRLIASKGADDLFGVVTFGHTASVEMPLTKEPDFQGFQTQPDPSFSDLAGALRLAAGLIPDGYARQLVLVSDGRQNLGDAAATAAALRAQGVRVDVVPAGHAPSAETLVTSVDVASQLREGEVPSATVHLRATVPASGKLTLLVDGTEAASRDVQLPQGDSSQTFQLSPLAVGLHKVRAELVAQPDTFSENDVGEAVIKVLGRPLVLVLEGKPNEGDNIAIALRAAGMSVDQRPAASAPTDTATLGRYDSTIVVDSPADSFPQDSLAAIAASVHDLGKGLVTVGGPTAYGPGGWQGTPLEQALPVRMDVPNRKEKPKVAVVLVMESMEDPGADQVVLGAAESVVGQLSPDDQVAVTDGRQGFVVDMTQARDKAAIDAKIEQANLGDPPSYLSYVQQAADALQKTDAPLKHIVLLGDGDAESDMQQPLQSVIEGARSKGITTSAVAVDVHSQPRFMTNMQDISRWGGGRFYQSNSPSQVPQLFLKETITSLRPWYEQDAFFPKIGATGDLLQGVTTSAFPQLGGYVVTTAKPAAEQELISPKQDPVLASWSYGLGRSVAWTSDSNGAWTQGFLQSPVSAQLFARMVAWTLPTGGQQSVKVQASPSGDGIQLSVTGPSANGLTVQAGVVGPDLQSQTVDLRPTAPGEWQGRVSGSLTGTYLIHATVMKGGQSIGQADIAVSVPYSPEYLELGRDTALLQQTARAGAGISLSSPDQAWSQPTLPVPVGTEIFWILLALVALLWPLDVAMRRLTVSPHKVVQAAIELAREGAHEVEASPELNRLRGRLSEVRQRSRARADPPPMEVGEKSTSDPAQPTTGPQPSAEQAELTARLLEARRKRRKNG